MGQTDQRNFLNICEIKDPSQRLGSLLVSYDTVQLSSWVLDVVFNQSGLADSFQQTVDYA